MTSCTGPSPPADPFYLIDGPQNTWSQLRIANATMNISWTEFRPQGSPIHRASTNWTELYDLATDEWQGTNLAPTASPALLRALSDELWAVATCATTSCP